MGNKSLTILVMVVTVLVLSHVSYGELYNFTGGQTTHLIYFDYYIDGVNNSWEFTTDQYNGSMQIDIDDTAMTATYTQLYSQANNLEETHVMIKEQLGPDVEIPVTCHLSSSFFDMQNSYLMPINQDLEVSGRGVSIAESADYTGYLEIDEQQYNFDFTSQFIYAHISDQFDDSGYPTYLNLSSHKTFLTDNINYRLVQTSIGGHSLEIYAHGGFEVSGDWQGEIVPEPSTLFLLSLGVIILKRKSG